MAAKMEEPILHVQVRVIGQIKIAVARFYYRMTRGVCLLSLLQDREPDWESGSGLGLAQYIARQNSSAHTCAKRFWFLHNLEFTSLSRLRNTRMIYADAGQRQPLEYWTRSMTRKNNTEEIYERKSRELWGNGREEETKLDYKSVALPIIWQRTNI